jgi:decaprenyl-phosphate phosphoribosyltransferase
LRPYIQIARPDHWFKQFFMFPGLCLAFLFLRDIPANLAGNLILGLVSTCCIASANYCINEYLDAPNDRQHPTKYLRPAAQGLVRLRYVLLEYALLACLGLWLGFYINKLFGFTALFLLIMGICYNVPPLRTKDVPYLDVISESINNPLRLILGWAICIPDHLPPSSFLLAYWCGGAFLMALKRFAELRSIRSKEVMARYRKSLASYTERKLLVSAFFYAMNTALFLGISLIKYKIEFIFLFPLVALLFSWYFSISMNADSVVQTPEKLFHEKKFMLYTALLVVLFCATCFINVQSLQFLLEPIN